MTKQEIKDNAPHWATHYAYSNNGRSLHYLKNVDGSWYKSHFDDIYNRQTWGLFIYSFLDIKPL